MNNDSDLALPSSVDQPDKDDGVRALRKERDQLAARVQELRETVENYTGAIAKLTDDLNKAEAMATALGETLQRLDTDIGYLERTYPDLYSTRAGYVLLPRVIEYRITLTQWRECKEKFGR